MKHFAILALAISIASAVPVQSDVCNNPAGNWTYDWEYGRIRRYYRLSDRDGDGRYETISIQFRSTHPGAMRVAFTWKGRSLGDVFTEAKRVVLKLEKGAISGDTPELTISIPQAQMKASDTCFAGFYADNWNISEAN